MLEATRRELNEDFGEMSDSGRKCDLVFDMLAWRSTISNSKDPTHPSVVLRLSPVRM